MWCLGVALEGGVLFATAKRACACASNSVGVYRFSKYILHGEMGELESDFRQQRQYACRNALPGTRIAMSISMNNVVCVETLVFVHHTHARIAL